MIQANTREYRFQFSPPMACDSTPRALLFRALNSIPGVCDVTLEGDKATIKKLPQATWGEIHSRIEERLTAFMPWYPAGKTRPKIYAHIPNALAYLSAAGAFLIFCLTADMSGATLLMAFGALCAAVGRHRR